MFILSHMIVSLGHSKLGFSCLNTVMETYFIATLIYIAQ